MRFSIISDKSAKYLFVLSIVLALMAGTFAYGVLAGRESLFPVPWLKNVYRDLEEVLSPGDSILVTLRKGPGPKVETLQPDKVVPGLLMIVGAVKGTRDSFVRIIDRNGNIVHEWIAQWKGIWGDEVGNIVSHRIPRGDRGMNLHGIDILPDASIVANFEHLSTFRMNICGDLEWKLDNLGHHSVFYSDQGYLWVTAERYIEKGQTGYQNHTAPLNSGKIQKISLDGKILKEIEIIDVLMKNDLYGLLYLSSIDDSLPRVTGDTLHLNDVDEFPVGMASDIFAPGDIMVSLRNISALIVFDPETLKIKFRSVGQFLRQHDPDFMPDDRISVFDNRNLRPSKGPVPLGGGSRIYEINAIDGSGTVVLNGEGRFFSGIMGVHQRLANGNILVTSFSEGRVIDFAPDGTVVWHYDNQISEKANGGVYMAKLLPEHMNEAFFRKQSNSCKK